MKIHLTLRRLISAFGNDQRGTIAFITIVSAIPLVLLTFYLVNSSKAIHEHTRTQDAADMIALVHAAEAARSLNTISMNQVTMTQAFASGVTAGTLYDVTVAQIALDIAAGLAVGVLGAKKCAKLITIPPAFAICLAPYVAKEIEIIANGLDAKDLLSTYDPKGAFKVAEKTVHALNAKNKEIVNRFPEAVSVAAKQIAGRRKKDPKLYSGASDIYFDDSCKKPAEASSCKTSNKRQGMNLPVDKNKGRNPNLIFCAALHFGTVGAGFSLGPLAKIPGLSEISATAMNGSYLKRGFTTPLKGPMYGGANNKHLRDYINKKTGIGGILKDYYDLAKSRSMWGDSIAKKVPFLQYRFKQTKKNNFYTVWVTAKIFIQCGKLESIPSLGFLLKLLKNLTHDVPAMDLYHPADQGLKPTIQPGLSDYSDKYKPLAFVYRKPNERWKIKGSTTKVFKHPKKGFYAYSQSLVYNPDEIGLYSQNWRARLIPAKKMMSLSPILSRMGTKAPSNFKHLKSDLESVSGDSSWSTMVVK